MEIIFNYVVDMLSRKHIQCIGERDDAARKQLEMGTKEQVLRLMDAYNDLKVQHAQLNTKYTALCVRLRQIEDHI